MDRVAFQIVDGGEFEGDTVRILINGVDLAELAQVVEARESDRGQSGPAGAYAGLPYKHAAPPSRHLLGEPDPLYTTATRQYVLICDCGEPGCWPLLARVVFSEHEVTWSDFGQAHRDWDLTGLGPFRFDRAQYEAALHALTTE